MHNLKKTLLFAALIVTTITSSAFTEISLNGTTERVWVKNNPIFNKGKNGGYTVECAVKTTDKRGVLVSRIGENGQGFILGVKNDRFLAKIVNGSDSILITDGDTPIISDGEWHHVAFTIEGSKANFYVDGETIVAEKNYPFLTKAWKTDDDVFAGWTDVYAHCNGAIVGFLEGKIKSLRIWKKCLPSSSIKENIVRGYIPSGSSNKDLIFSLVSRGGQLEDTSYNKGSVRLITSKEEMTKTPAKPKKTSKTPADLTVKNINGSVRGCYEGKILITTKNLRKVRLKTDVGYDYSKPNPGKIYIAVTAPLKKGYSISAKDYKIIDGNSDECECFAIKEHSSDTFIPGSGVITNKDGKKLIFNLLFEVSKKAGTLKVLPNLQTTAKITPITFDLVEE